MTGNKAEENREEILYPIEREAARFLLNVADALSEVESTASYGEFYVEEVTIAFDGDTTTYRVVPNGLDNGYDIAISIPAPRAKEADSA